MVTVMVIYVAGKIVALAGPMDPDLCQRMVPDVVAGIHERVPSVEGLVVRCEIRLKSDILNEGERS